MFKVFNLPLTLFFRLLSFLTVHLYQQNNNDMTTKKFAPLKKTTIEVFPAKRTPALPVVKPVINRAAPAPLPRAVLPHKHIENDNAHTYKFIPNLFIGTNKQIPVYTFYIASDGDMVLFGILDNQKVSELVLCSEIVNELGPEMVTRLKIKDIFKTDKDLAKLNIDLDNYVAPIIETPISAPTNRTRIIKSVNPDMVELAELTYGEARRDYIHKEFQGINIDDYIIYDGRNIQKDGKTIYQGILMCDKVNEAAAIKLIKDIIATQKKTTICFL